ncbi:MAG: hypothetical protein MUP55_03180 [Candidatus Aenigmarchaeota archaeon]|nr:hypothetical protein [Candidatus Aenigmarchaeota archaeon]
MLTKKKADTEFVTTPLGVILFVGIVIAFAMFIQGSMAKFSADLVVSEKQLQVVDATHIVKDCLNDMFGAIPASTLDDLQEKQDSGINVVCDKCKICSIDAGAKVEYLEGPNSGKKPYDFNFRSGGTEHKIFVTISDGSKNYLSRLTVSVYGK